MYDRIDNNPKGRSDLFKCAIDGLSTTRVNQDFFGSEAETDGLRPNGHSGIAGP